MSVCLLYFCVPSVLQYCWLGLLTCKTVSQITYTVLVETLNPVQSINLAVYIQLTNDSRQKA